MRMWCYTGPQQLALAEGNAPRPGPGEVVIRVTACGICATDLKTYQRGHPLIPVGAVLGHEVVGIVAEIGAGVSGWQMDDRVAVAPYVACGACRFCRRGQFTLCEHLFDASLEPGGFTEFARVPPRLVQRGMFKLGATRARRPRAGIERTETPGSCPHFAGRGAQAESHSHRQVVH